MQRKTRLLLLAGILILAAFLRFYRLPSTPPGLYPDEAMDGNNAAEVAATGHYQVFYPEDNGREGLYVNLIALEFQLFHAPHEPWVVRFPAAVAGVLTVLGLYLLVSELFTDELGLLAAFLLAASFWHINFSRIGFRAILAPFFLTWSVWLLLKIFRAGGGKKESRAALWLAVLAGFMFGLGIYTYIAYRITPLLLVLFIPFFYKYPGFWKRAGAFVVTAFVTSAPLLWYFATHPGSFFGRTSEISVTSASNPIVTFAVNFGKTLLEINWQGDYNWRQNISGAPELFWPVGILFLIGVAWGIWWLIKNKLKKSAPNMFALLLLYAWFFLGALPAAFSDEGIPHALRSLLMLPPAIIFAALGGVSAYRFIEKYWHRDAALVLASIFLTVVALFAYYDYFIAWAQNPNVPGSFNADYVAIGREINALPVTTPKYVILNACGVLARGVPVPAETTMFITDTFTTSTQAAHNVHYVSNGTCDLPDQTNQIPANAPSSTIFEIN